MGHAEQVASSAGLKLLGKLPIVSEVASLADEGKIEAVEAVVTGFFDSIADSFLAGTSKINKGGYENENCNCDR